MGEAVLKLLIGLDGVTAQTVTELGYIYLAGQAINNVGILLGMGLVAWLVLKIQKRCFDAGMGG